MGSNYSINRNISVDIGEYSDISTRLDVRQQCYSRMLTINCRNAVCIALTVQFDNISIEEIDDDFEFDIPHD